MASGAFADLPAAMQAMSAPAAIFEPSRGPVRRVHDARFDAFCRLQSVAREIRESSERAEEPSL